MDEEALVSVVRGTPTAEEVAALVGVLLGRSRSTDAGPFLVPRSEWARSARPFAGPTSWRMSGLPR